MRVADTNDDGVLSLGEFLEFLEVAFPDKKKGKKDRTEVIPFNSFKGVNGTAPKLQRSRSAGRKKSQLYELKHLTSSLPLLDRLREAESAKNKANQRAHKQQLPSLQPVKTGGSGRSAGTSLFLKMKKRIGRRG